MTELAKIFLWTSVGLVLYTYVVYPLIVWLLARLCCRTSRATDLAPEQLPAVSLLVSAYNEERCIAARIQNTLTADYPPDKLEILVASDGSDDRTNDIVHRFGGRVRLLAYEERRGKAAALNAALPRANGEIVVFTDANTHFETGALQRLVRWFVDPEVGVVCGKLVLTDASTGRNVDGIYWRYETFLKQCEGQLGGLLGANGAIYAMRREFFCSIPDNTIIDDFVIPLLAKLKHRFRIVYDASAMAHEETAPTIGHEFHRRVRIGSGDYQSLFLLWPLLQPRHGWTAFTFVSHKLLRWLSPFFLLVALVANTLLLPQPLYTATFLAQATFYTTALVGLWLTGDGQLTKFIRATSLFCSVNLALLVGFFRWATEVQTGTWQRTERESISG